ncbi:phage major capsid protein [Arthrobacter citreus]|nr:phage major capsid protein [Arthrobacter citreus]
MKKIIELRQKRAKVVAESRQLIDDAEKRGGFTAEDEVSYDRMNTEIDTLTKDIERHERQYQLEQENNEYRDASGAGLVGGEQRNESPENVPFTQREEYRSAFNKFLVSGMAELNNKERTILGQGRAQMEGRALSAVTGSAGGFTVPQGFYNSLIESLKAFGGMRKVKSTILRTATGNTLPIPKVDDTANVGAIVGENTAAGNATDAVFSQLNLGAYKYTSKVFLIPIELLQDSAFDIEAYIRKIIATRIGRITNTHFTVGTGTGQPTGVLTNATLGKTGTTGQTTSIVYDDLIDLIHSVDPAYREAGDCEFMLNDNSLKAIRKLKDSQGNPLWQPGLVQGAPDKILNYNYTINQDMPTMAANAKSLLFGDLSTFIIRDVMDLSIFRMGEKFIDSGQVGFVAFSRHDSVLTDTAAVKYYANSAT